MKCVGRHQSLRVAFLLKDMTRVISFIVFKQLKNGAEIDADDAPSTLESATVDISIHQSKHNLIPRK